MTPSLLVALSVFLAFCACFDVLYRRIPNWLTCPAMLLALLVHGLTGGGAGLAHAIMGLAAGMALLMPFYLLKGMGAGDVKLMGVVGAFLGPTRVLHAFLWTGLSGGLYALILLAFRPHQLVIFLKNCLGICVLVGKYFLYGLNAARIHWILLKDKAKEREPVKVCYGVAIALGTMGSILWEHGCHAGWSELISVLSVRVF